jgi:hypothetical protein
MLIHRLPAQIHLVDRFLGEEPAGRKQRFFRHDAERLETYRAKGRGVFKSVVHIEQEQLPDPRRRLLPFGLNLGGLPLGGFLGVVS